jgi:signal transduction histidine kinase
VSAPRPHAAWDGHLDRHLDRFTERLLAPDAVGLRLVAFTVVYTMSWVLVPLPSAFAAWGGTVAWFEMWLGLVMVLGAQVAGVLIPWDRIPVGWQSVPPLVQMGALVALQHGSGAAVASVDALLLLPVVSLGLQATRSAVVLATAGTVGVQMGLVLGGPELIAEPAVPRAVVPVVAFLIALGTAAVAQHVRTDTTATTQTDTTALTEQPQDEVIGMVGHALRSPLTTVLGYAQLLGAGSLTDDQHTYADVIERSGRRQLRLIDELLVSVRLAAGQHSSIARKNVDLVRVSRACVDELGPTAWAAGLSLTVVTPGPVAVSGDPELLAQAITILLDDAIRRTPRGGAVTLRAGLRGVATQEAVIEVADTGVGMGPDELGRLIERLDRYRAAKGRTILGFGLGLPVVQAIVDAHAGTMGVGSPPGAGTRITVTLPTGSSTDSPTSSSVEAASTPR